MGWSSRVKAENGILNKSWQHKPISNVAIYSFFTFVESRSILLFNWDEEKEYHQTL